MIRGWLSVGVALAVTVGSARASEPAPHKLAAAALKVLKQHCGDCHGREQHGGLRITAHGALLREDRGLIVPKMLDASVLLTRVEVGSMPPGKRAKLNADDRQTLRKWIATGARPWFGTDYVIGHLLDDIREVPASDRPFVRYVRLDHLWDAPRAETEVGNRREKLAAVLQYFAGVRRELLAPVDAAGSLFRFDLRELDWDRRLFHVMQGRKEVEAASLNLFDLLLLEYDLAERLDALKLSDDVVESLRKEYLVPAELVRPIPAVRGDWLAVQAMRESFERELRRKESTLSAPSELAALRELARAGAPEAALLPLDSLTPDEHPRTFELTFKTNKPNNTFRTDEKMIFLLENPTREAFWIEIVHTDMRGKKQLITAPVELKAGERLQFPPEKAVDDYFTGDDPGTDYLTVYASRQRWSEGRLLRAEGLRDRFVHSFYALDRDGKVENPIGMQVRTFPLKIVRTDAER